MQSSSSSVPVYSVPGIQHIPGVVSHVCQVTQGLSSACEMNVGSTNPHCGGLQSASLQLRAGQQMCPQGPQTHMQSPMSAATAQPSFQLPGFSVTPAQAGFAASSSLSAQTSLSNEFCLGTLTPFTVVAGPNANFVG